MPAILSISPHDQVHLTNLARTARTASLAQRYRIILASVVQGATVTSIARQLGTSPATVRRWQDHFRTAGLVGLTDASRPGAPRQIDSAQRAAVLELQAEGMHSRQIANETGISQSSISRILREGQSENAASDRPPVLPPIEKVVEQLAIVLFDSLADEIPLARFLNLVETVVRADFGIMLIFSRDRRKPSLILSEGKPLEGSEDYITKYYEQELLDDIPEGRVTTISDLLTRDELHQT